jgi:hypothetical protein
VSESIKKFDARQSKPDSVLVISFYDASQESTPTSQEVCGQEVVDPVDFWCPQEDMVKKIFKITDAELNMEAYSFATTNSSRLIRPVITRVSIRDQL